MEAERGKKKKGMLHALFKWSPFHNEVGFFSLLWIEFTLHFGISG